MQNHPPSNPYRNDIDGLRALAVILVILFHAGFSKLPSGFIGVDIFFAISGFLMTGIIIRKVEKKSFSLSEFFIHRLWRIQPALIFMSVATLLATVWFYLPDDFQDYLHSAKYNALFLSNQFFSRQSAAYASPAADLFPLLHTWSLAIEWQWYLFLPLGVLSASALLRLKPFRPLNKINTLAGLWLSICLIAAVMALTVPFKESASAYYSLLARVFEFMIGGAAYFLTRYVRNIPAAASNGLSFLALALIVYTALMPGVIGQYPNIYALFVVVAAALIMFTGSYGGNYTSRLLSLRPVAFTGRISYSLYLWHWPVFAIARYLGYVLEGTTLISCLALTVLLSFISFYLVEQPCRRCRWPLKASVPVLVLAPIIIFGSVYSYSDHHQGLPARFGADYDQVANNINSSLVKAGHRPDCLDGSQNPERCMFGDLAGNKTALLIGDSHANHFWGFFDVLGKDAHVKMTSLSTPLCLALPDIYLYDWWSFKNDIYNKCHSNTEKYYDLIKSGHYNYVIIGHVWEWYESGPHVINNAGDLRSDALSKERISKAMHKAIDIIVASGARPVLVRTVAPMPVNYQSCIRNHVIFREPYRKAECDSQNPQSPEKEWTLPLFNQLQKDYPALIIIDPKKIQCADNDCVTAIGETPIYRDVGHLNDYASYQFGEQYLQRFGNPLK